MLEPGRDWRAWTLYDREPVECWTDSRVAPLGDAAHPMLQYAAQGACQTVEDAAVLSELLRGHPAGFVQLLEKYSAPRRKRTARVQLVAREMGSRLYHAASSARTERNTMLSALSAGAMCDKVAWLREAAPLVRAR
ncbi:MULTISPECIES: hypothetical protein [unclassified Streptomyces]|uniref:hypothetical protein n=1 Tax=unclassified Streptomyces TaxID=2593676 RepID=UPI000DAC1EE1|nr:MULTISPECIES: hypothetical protein [unclassified Streptomyces]PZT74835.1 hypothetical protein DNK55_22565 [Streptomyces sp. AC1-42T]PZT82181.1 hypothetical protein DNK56_08880 [Streptomyces sp. AC1-42W]